MPCYEYECASCQKIIEVEQRISEAPLTTCPECGKPIKRIISRTSFALKGSGWYTTDYKRASAPSPSSTVANPAPSTAPSESTAAPCTPTGCEKPGCASKTKPD